MKKSAFSDNSALPIMLVAVALGVIFYLILSSTAPLGGMLGQVNPKSESNAAKVKPAGNATLIANPSSVAVFDTVNFSGCGYLASVDITIEYQMSTYTGQAVGPVGTDGCFNLNIAFSQAGSIPVYSYQDVSKKTPNAKPIKTLMAQTNITVH